MTTCVHLLLFREDLRTRDHRALRAATDFAHRHPDATVLALYVLDEETGGIRPLGGASHWWLHHSLAELQESLENLGIPLFFARGQGTASVASLSAPLGITHLHWSRRYTLPERSADAALKTWAKSQGIEAHSYAGQLLHEPWEVSPASGDFYKVFTPFWKAISAQGFREPYGAPEPLTQNPAALSQEVRKQCATLLSLEELDLLPTRPDWSGGLKQRWTPGEKGALAACNEFVDGNLEGYARERDFPAAPSTSFLSPHLRFGEISPATVLYRVGRSISVMTTDTTRFATEVGWREFCWHLAFHNPELHEKEFRAEWSHFPWGKADNPENKELFHAWCRGLTGVPLVDAGMRELWETGYMHNRVRMVVASYLTKNLLLDWKLGEKWFWDTLVDADLASNPANWQWVAGSGADAAPYFRIFNPVTQGKKFDEEARYIKRWVPELAHLSAVEIHRGAEQGYGVLAPDYPSPLVDLKFSRQEALAAYSDWK